MGKKSSFAFRKCLSGIRLDGRDARLQQETSAPIPTSLTKSLIQQSSESLMFVIMHLAICLGNRTWHTETLNQCLLSKGIKEEIKTMF